ncbi:MAG: rod shape-determining protein [Lachnospiraceae bacterium]|nr:rod shape-determining protein [Lachnospiraceae bacterium]
MLSNSYGIDMGTANLKIYNNNNDDVTSIKNTIAIVEKNEMYAYGDEAYAMYEKAPEMIQVSFPIVSGVIADFDNMQTMLFSALEEKAGAKLKGADVVLAVPTGITEVEQRAFYEIFSKSKVKTHSIALCEKPLATALGMGLDITQPTGIMVVDFGADTTEISVISLGGLVITELLPFGGNQLDEAIVTYMKRKFNLVIGMKTACQLKEQIGSAMPGKTDTYTVVGRDVVSGLPIEMEISAKTVYEGIKSNLESLCNSIKMLLEKVPPELAKDVVHSGIYLSGGSSKIDSLDVLFKEVTNIDVNIADNADNTVVLGLKKVLTDSKYSKFGHGMKPRIFK